MKRIRISLDVALRYVTCRSCGNVLSVIPSTIRGKDVIRCGVCRYTGTYTYAPIGFCAEPYDPDDEDETEEDEREEIRA